MTTLTGIRHYVRNNFITNYADLSKTADKVRHKQIIRKLKRNEILVKLLKLVKDLEQRTTKHFGHILRLHPQTPAEQSMRHYFHHL